MWIAVCATDGCGWARDTVSRASAEATLAWHAVESTGHAGAAVEIPLPDIRRRLELARHQAQRMVAASAPAGLRCGPGPATPGFPEPEEGTRTVDATARSEPDAVWSIVLAGGHGRRLAAFLRTVLGDTRPKQLCRIIGRRSMLRHTWDRALRLVPARRIVTVITAGQERCMAAEAREGIPGRVLVQPTDRDTGPGLLLPLLWIADRQPAARVVVFPADHFIWEEARFLTAVTEAVGSSRQHPERIVLLGMEPDRPETSYGWIEPGRPYEGVLPSRELFAVTNFWEKPNLGLARHLQAAGCLWNSFVMAGTVAAFLQLVRRQHPEVLDVLQPASRRVGSAAERDALAAAYRHLTPLNVSRDLLTPGRDALLVAPVRGLTWSDWGEPARILQTLQRIGHAPPWLAALAPALRPDAPSPWCAAG